MTDPIFIKLLNHLGKQKNLTRQSANEPIKKVFPKLEFLKGKLGTKIYFPQLVKYQMDKIEPTDLESILDLIDPLMYKLYAPNKTIKEFGVLDNAYSQYIRNPIRARFGKDSEYYDLSKQLTALTDSDKGDLIKFQSKKLEERNKERVEYDPEEVINNIKNNITSIDPYKRGIALLLSSGSRPIELYAKSTYTIDKDTPDGWIKQTYVAKKKGDKTKAYVVKPVLYIKPKQFIEEVSRLRKDLEQAYGNYEQDGKIKTNVLDKFQKAAKEIFNYKEDFVSYTSRPLYGLVSYHKVGKFPNLFGDGSDSINVWIKKVLGHDGLGTSENYTRFKLKKDAPSVTQTTDDIKIKQVELDKKIEDIEERLEDLNVQEKDESEFFNINNKDLKQKFKLLDVEYEKLKIDRLGRPPPMYRIELYARQQKIPRSAARVYYKSKTQGKI